MHQNTGQPNLRYFKRWLPRFTLYRQSPDRAARRSRPDTNIARRGTCTLKAERAHGVPAIQIISLAL